jgi:hypothetical protein
MKQGPYPAEKARGGEIILNTPLRRAVFLGGLIGVFVVALVMMLLRWARHFAMRRNDPVAALFPCLHRSGEMT